MGREEAAGAPPAGIAAFEQDPPPLGQLHAEVWTERDGLPQNFIPTLAQTRDGYLWAGTERGLVRFDGLAFNVFLPGGPDDLPSPWVTTLAADPDGSLWVGTGAAEVVHYRAGRFRTLIDREALGGAAAIQAVLPDGRGGAWVGTDGGGLFLLDADGATRIHLGAGSGLSSSIVHSLARVGSVLWVGTGRGLDRVDAESGDVLEREDGAPVLPDAPGHEAGVGEPIRALLAASDGVLWAGTESGRVLRIHGESSLRPGPEAQVGTGAVTSFAEDARGSVWVGVNGGGLHRIHGGAHEVLREGAVLPGNLVRSLLVDREGNLWVGQTAAGLIRLQEGAFRWLGAPEGLSMDVALGVLEDRRGDLWVGTPGGGLNQLSGYRDPMPRVRRWGVADGLGADFVLSVSEAPDGSIWAGTQGGGVARIQGGVARAFGLEDGLLEASAQVVHHDADGQLWIGYRTLGVHRFPGSPAPGAGESWGPEDGLPSGGITAIENDSGGGIWVGTRAGLAHLQNGTMTRWGVEEGLPHGHVLGIHPDRHGSVWVATMGGLARVREGRVFAFEPRHGLPDIAPMSMVEDEQGELWISTSQGVLRASRAALEEVAEGVRSEVAVRHYGRADGMRSSEANAGFHPAAWRNNQGEVLFPTMAGVVRIDPTLPGLPRTLPEPVLEAVVTSAGPVSLDAPVRLSSEIRNVEFHFAVPAFRSPESLEVRYRLEGWDEAWRDAGSTRVARYTNLPPRNYRFQVEVRDRTAPGGEEAAALQAVASVRLEPRVHERGWVRAGALALLVLLAGALYRRRIRSLEAREDELLRLVRDRERATAALEESEERLRLAMEAGKLGTWEWDLAYDQVSWSQGVDRFFGAGPVTGEAFVHRMRERIPEDDFVRTLALVDRVRSGEGREFATDFQLQANGANPLQVQLRGRRIEATPEDPVRIVGVAADVTALIRTQKELRAREEELRHAQKMEAVGNLAGGVAHDFNNLLQVIGMNARLALEAVEPGTPAHEEIQETVRAADRATALTRQLLAFSRKQILQPRALDLNDSVQGVERMLRRLLRTNVLLETHLEEALPPILADEGGVEQVLVNLLVNAQDAMPQGGTITIRTRSVAPRAGGGMGGNGHPEGDDSLDREGHVLLTVSDTGKGIDPEYLERIFDPFFTTKEVGQGTGLGLASVYGVVQQSGGRVEVESAPGEGATFLVRFPLAREGVPA